MRYLNFEFTKSFDETILITCYDNLGIESEKGIEVGLISVDKTNTITIIPNETKISIEDYHDVKNSILIALLEFTYLTNVSKQGPNYIVDNVYNVLNEYITVEKSISL